MNNNYKKFVITFLISTIFMLLLGMILVVTIDPYFHYRKPNLLFSYKLENERYINDGILKHFDYNGIITGTSMTENFFKTEADKIFRCNFIKVPFSGASYKEVNDNINTGLFYNKNIKIIIRGLDYDNIFQSSESMRYDMGPYPIYLYDENIFNDVKYIFNIGTVKTCLMNLFKTFVLNMHGLENDFDSYSNWQSGWSFGPKIVLKDVADFDKDVDKDEVSKLTDEERVIIEENIKKNVLSTAIAYPNVKFYYFFTPYSCAWWGKLYKRDGIDRQIDAEKFIIEMILPIKNIYLFSFNNFFEITTDLNNYKDAIHYGEWINTDILNNMKNNVGLLTNNNYLKYIDEERKFYKNFDYNSLFNQFDEPDRPIKLK